MSVRGTPPFQTRLLLPQFWLAWIGIFILWCFAYFPWRVQYAIASWLGNTFWRIGKRRRNDTLINLRLCFPDKSEAERIEMGREIFRNGALGAFESLSAWFNPTRFNDQVTIDGLEHLKAAQSQQKGVLLLGGHYTTLDQGGYLSSLFFDATVVYRPQNNPLFDWLITRARATLFAEQIDYDDMRGLVRVLKAGQTVWYSPDQDFGLKQGVMAPFFGIPAASITAPRRLVRINDSPVLAFHSYRASDFPPRYHITISPILEHYPSDDPVADATRVNALFEQLIRIAPTQWMWFHRRFKSQPPGVPSPYKQAELAESNTGHPTA